MKNINYLIIIFAGVLFVLVFGSLFLMPKYQDFAMQNSEIKIKKQELEEVKKYYTNINQTMQELQKYGDQISKIDSSLPSDFSLASLLNFLQQTSSQSGLVLKNISPVNITQEKDSKIKIISLSTVVTGSYQDFKKLLNSLEKSARLVEIESISFTSPDKKEKVTNFDFTLKVKVYSY